MKEKVMIQKENQESFEADLVSFFEFNDTKKRYIFFTKNEVVEDNLEKLYVSEAIVDGANFKIQNAMNDAEWTAIKEVMRNILTGKENPNIKYLEVGK